MDFLDYALPGEPREDEIDEAPASVDDSAVWPPKLRKETAASLMCAFGWLSPEQLAAAYGVHFVTIYRWIEKAEGDQAEQEKVRRLLRLDA